MNLIIRKINIITRSSFSVLSISIWIADHGESGERGAKRESAFSRIVRDVYAKRHMEPLSVDIEKNHKKKLAPSTIISN